jgi:hypothetical protein
MVTNAGPGFTSGSRTARKAGRSTSPTARPTRKIAAKPTVVAANVSRKEACGASGFSSARQRNARIRYVAHTMTTPAATIRQSARPIAPETSAQFRPRPNHTSTSAASTHRTMNFKYFPKR